MPKGIKGFQKGHKNFLTRESYKKISKKLTGRKHAKETREKISIANKGKNFSGVKNGIKTRFKATGSKGIKLLGKNGYRNIHKWVEKELGQPTKCEHCGQEGLTGRQIHWANVDGAYRKNKYDWIRLCVKCHFIADKLRQLPKFKNNSEIILEA